MAEEKKREEVIPIPVPVEDWEEAEESVSWQRELERGVKFKHHPASKWILWAIILANVVGLLLLWTSFGADPSQRYVGLNIILGIDAVLTAFVLVSEEQLVRPKNRTQMWISLGLNLFALATINFSVLEMVGLGDKALLVWPATIALLVGLVLDWDALRDYKRAFPIQKKSFEWR